MWLHFKHVGVFGRLDFSGLLPHSDGAVGHFSAIQADLDGHFALRVRCLRLGGGQPHQAAAVLHRKVAQCYLRRHVGDADHARCRLEALVRDLYQVRVLRRCGLAGEAFKPGHLCQADD